MYGFVESLYRTPGINSTQYDNCTSISNERILVFKTVVHILTYQESRKKE